MSFFERAKAAAGDLAAKADAEIKKAGISTPGSGLTGSTGASGGADADRALRDLGVLAYLEATGRPASAADRAHVIATLHDLESNGRLGRLDVTPAYGAPGGPPPPPGAVAASAAMSTAPPPPGGTPPPPPPPGAAPPGSTPPPPTAAPPGSTPPPPPPSWA